MKCEKRGEVAKQFAAIDLNGSQKLVLEAKRKTILSIIFL
jgi:hypothetical protein